MNSATFEPHQIQPLGIHCLPLKNTSYNVSLMLVRLMPFYKLSTGNLSHFTYKWFNVFLDKINFKLKQG